MPVARPRPSGTQGRVELPEYQPMGFPLTDKAQASLSALTRRHPVTAVEQYLTKALQVLSEDVAELNDNYHAHAEPLATRRERLARMSDPSEAEQQSIDELQGELDAMKKRVEELTTRMEENVRRTIDSQQSVGHVISTIDELCSSTAISSQLPEQDENEEPSTMATFTPTDPSGGTQRRPLQGYKTRFSAAIEQKQDRYTAYTPAQRYASNNSYRTFKKLLHDAQHPDQPVPHESTWFASPTRRPAPGETAHPSADSDDDLLETRATISTKCPLTLREFAHPVTSSKCPHSFESSAIEDLISSSRLRLGADGSVTDTATQRRGRNTQPVGGEACVRCPVPGCASVLTRRDLGEDPVLVRRIARLQRAAARAAEEDDEGGRGRKRRRDGRSLVSLGSSMPGSDVEDEEEEQIKGERARTQRLSEEL